MRAFIFDLDGTLLDSLKDIGTSCNKVLAENGFPEHPVEEYRQMVGNGFDMLIHRALPSSSGLSETEITEITRQAKKWYAENMTVWTTPFEGMVEALGALADSGAYLAVLSNKPDKLSKELVRFYFPETPFAYIHGARPDLPLKPDPAMLLELLDNFAIAKDEACYIGDSNVDIYTARNAGICGVGAAWGFRGAAELEAAGADILLRAPSELPRLHE